MNKYTQHTPGPWAIDINGNITDTAGRLIVPLVYAHNVPNPAFPRGSGQYLAEDDGGEANARLIAAAPDLLATLRLLLAEVLRANEVTTENIKRAITKVYGDIPTP